MSSFEARLRAAKVLPVLEPGSVEEAVGVAEALAEGGVSVIELTWRHASALDGLKAVKDAKPDMTVGMGTVTTSERAFAATEAGADFLVSPGITDALLKAFCDLSIPSLPGVASASDAMRAREAGFSKLKFFPAETSGGAAAVKALAGPLPDLLFCPTGGIGKDMVEAYLRLPNVMCVGGSWVAPKDAIAARDWAAIVRNAAVVAGLHAA